jgi:hypothetical protein
MAAMRQADSADLIKLRSVFPDIYDEMVLRYNATGWHYISEEFDDE